MTTELEQEFYDTFGIENPDEIVLIAFISAIKDDIKTVQDYKENKDAVLRSILENKELFPYVKQGYEQVRDIMIKNNFEKLSNFYKELQNDNRA